MDCSCIRQTDLPGTTRLFADLVYHPDRVASFYLPPDDDFAFPADRRAGLVEALREQNPGNPLLERLAQDGTVAIVTGQQVGLYSGPAYTLYKALTAIKLAADLTASGKSAVPIFWLATEDHDFLEVNQAWVFDGNTESHRLETAATPRPNQPVGTVELGNLDFGQLRRGLRNLPWADEIAGQVESAYQPGATFGQAFGALLRKLLGDRQILLLILSQAVDAADDLTNALLVRNKELDEAGYHAQVHIEKETSLFFLLDGGKRVSLKRQNGSYVGEGKTWTASDLQSRAAELSPNALLRPVIQDYMIPTHTYVGGPAELSYLAQSSVLYQRLLGRQPHAVHRSGFTVIDAHSHKLMNRYKLDLPAFFPGEQALRERAAQILVPPALTKRLEETRSTASAALSRLKSELLAFDPTLAKALNRSGRKIEFQLSKIADKVGRQAIARDERATRDARTLSNLIFPHNHLQERFYSALPLLAKHGPALVDDLYGQIQLSCPDHQLVTA